MAEREVRLARAKWVGPQKIRLRFDPFAYRYVRLQVLERDGHICHWCGQPGDTMDHVIPWSKGGRTTMNNCICACQECNGRRGDMAPGAFASLCGVPMPQPGAMTRSATMPLPQIEATARPLPMPAPLLRLEVKPEPEPETEATLVPRASARLAMIALLDPLGHHAAMRAWY